MIQSQKQLTIVILLLFISIGIMGCLGEPIQQYVVEERAFVKGKIVVPPGKNPVGIKIQVAGKDNSVKIYENPYFVYADENGNYELELRSGGRYLLFARGTDFNINYGWVDTFLEETVTATDITLTEKVMGEAVFTLSLVDFEEVDSPEVCIKNPSLGSDTYALYDDGTHGDRTPGDKIWTRTVNGLTSGRIEYKLKNKGEEKNDPYQESALNKNSVIYVKPSQVRTIDGQVMVFDPLSQSRLSNYNGITVATNKGVRISTLAADGTFQLPVSGTGSLPVVFRGNSIQRKAVSVNVTGEGTVPLYNVVLETKVPGEALFVILATDFPGLTNPKVLGEFSNFLPVPLYDDGTHGDDIAGDGIFTLLQTGIQAGPMTYQIMPFDIALRDPYEESSNQTNSIFMVK